MVSNERIEKVTVEQLFKCLDLCEVQTGTDAVILFYKMLSVCAHAMHDLAGRDEALFALEAARKCIEKRADTRTDKEVNRAH